MSNTTSIIVYRNPMEQAFWESGLVFPLMVTVAVTIIYAMIAGKFLESLPWQYQRAKWVSNLYLISVVIVGILTFRWMWI